MEVSTGAQIFWMIALGLTIGFVSHYVYGKEGVALVPSIIVGLAGSLVTGISALIFNFSMALAYSIIGSLGFLFVVNTFRQKDRTVFIDTDHTKKEEP